MESSPWTYWGSMKTSPSAHSTNFTVPPLSRGSVNARGGDDRTKRTCACHPSLPSYWEKRAKGESHVVERSQLLASLGSYHFTAQGISARSLQGHQHPSLSSQVPDCGGEGAGQIRTWAAKSKCCRGRCLTLEAWQSNQGKGSLASGWTPMQAGKVWEADELCWISFWFLSSQRIHNVMEQKELSLLLWTCFLGFICVLSHPCQSSGHMGPVTDCTGS